MKILQIHNEYSFKGGEEDVVESEKKILIQNKCKVFQLIRKNKYEINNIFQKINVAKNLSYSKKSYQIVESEIIKIKPDIVHIHNTFPLWTFSVIEACSKLKIPIVMTLHNFRLICAKGVFYRNNQICEICTKSSPLNAIRYGCYQNSIIKSIPVAFMIQKYRKGLNLLKKVNKVIVLTEFSKKKFLEINFPENKIAVKPNSIPINFKFNTEIKKSGFLYASRLSEEKGILDLIIAHKKFNFDLTVCGDGPLKKELITNKKIKYLGFLKKNNLIKIMEKSKFLIFPSKCYEGFPIVFLYAFSLETIVIAPKLGSISSIIKHKKNGILFKPNDIDDLINKIKWVLSNKNKCEEIKKNAKKEFEEKYSDQINYKMLIKIYEEAINDTKKN